VKYTAVDVGFEHAIVIGNANGLVAGAATGGSSPKTTLRTVTDGNVTVTTTSVEIGTAMSVVENVFGFENTVVLPFNPRAVPPTVIANVGEPNVCTDTGEPANDALNVHDVPGFGVVVENDASAPVNGQNVGIDAVPTAVNGVKYDCVAAGYAPLTSAPFKFVQLIVIVTPVTPDVMGPLLRAARLICGDVTVWALPTL
jgi:hypothetical protein